jgi:hypothetical protein
MGPKGWTKKQADDAGLDEITEEDDTPPPAAAANESDDLDLKELLRSLTNQFKEQSLQINTRLGALEQRDSSVAGDPRAASARSIAGSATASGDSIGLEQGSLAHIVGVASDDYQHDTDTRHISSQWRLAITQKPKLAAWTPEDTYVLNETSLYVRVFFLAIDTLSQVQADPDGRVEETLHILYTVEAQLRKTLGRLQLRLHAPANTAQIVWRAAQSRQDRFSGAEIYAQFCKVDSASPILPILSVKIGNLGSNPVNS